MPGRWGDRPPAAEDHFREHRRLRDRPPGLADRGPGEFVGARQSGVPLLRYADLELDADLVDMAREVAETMLVEHPALAEKHLQRWLGSREELLKS
jgi:hypothetical protein